MSGGQHEQHAPGLPVEMLNQSMATIASMATTFSLNNAIMRVPSFNGKTPPLKDFLQDVRNGYAYVTEDQRAQYVSAVLGKLYGAARDSVNEKTFATLEALLTHLKKRFAPTKNYTYFLNRINTLQMRQGDTVGDFFDRLNILL